MRRNILAVALIVTVAEPPLASVPMAHVTVAPLCEQVPAVEVADTNPTFEGSVSVAVVAAALFGPLLVTLIV